MFVKSVFNSFVSNRSVLIESIKSLSKMRISLIFRNFFRV